MSLFAGIFDLALLLLQGVLVYRVWYSTGRGVREPLCGAPTWEWPLSPAQCTT